MSNHSTLFYNLMQFVGSSGLRFHDLRTLATFVWAIAGLLTTGKISLTQWLLVRSGPAKAASKLRQLTRWLDNDKIQPLKAYRPFVSHMLQEWAGQTVYLALDTSLLWNRFAIVRLALVYRGRALPVGWTVLTSSSATVALTAYESMLHGVAQVITPGSRVVLLADRGFVDVALLQLARDLGWHFRLRIKSNLWVYRATQPRQKVSTLMPQPGGARFMGCVWLTEQRFGPLHLALAHIRTRNGYEKWAIISNEPVGLHTLDEYGLRFDIEENFLDDKSAGFDLESSQIRDAAALARLCLILAVATVYLVSTGTAVVEVGRRYVVDTHWQRGLSYFQIGWRWVRQALAQGKRLLRFLWLNAAPDPEPAYASKKQLEEPDLWLSCIEWL